MCYIKRGEFIVRSGFLSKAPHFSSCLLGSSGRDDVQDSIIAEDTFAVLQLFCSVVRRTVSWCNILQFPSAIIYSFLVRYTVSWCDIQCPGAIYSVLVRYTVSWCDIQCPGAIYSVLVRYTVSWCDIQCPGAIYSVLVRYTVSWCDIQCPSAIIYSHDHSFLYSDGVELRT